jgi:hypothetical protein
MPNNGMGLQGEKIWLKHPIVYARKLPEELAGNNYYCPVMVVFRQAGEIGAVGEMLAKYGETPIGAIN